MWRKPLQMGEICQHGSKTSRNTIEFMDVRKEIEFNSWMSEITTNSKLGFNKWILEMDMRSRLDLIHGYQEWVQDFIDQSWGPYEISFMYHALPGTTKTILEQMKKEIYRVNSSLVTRFDRNPRSATRFNRLPRMMLFPDLPVYKHKKPSLNDVSINEGLHYGGIVLTPPISRFRSTLDTYFEENQKKYVNKRLARIHVEPIISNDWYVTDYVAKSIKRDTVSEDDIVILPRTPSEMPAEDLPAIFKGPKGPARLDKLLFGL
jgi:hypothetical protein